MFNKVLTYLLTYFFVLMSDTVADLDIIFATEARLD